VLDALPLSPNGKLDRRALPRPRPAAGAGEPRSRSEAVLAGIFAEVLGVERVGIHDHFFHLGGHSLMATRVAARVQEAFGVALPLHTLFQAPTVEALSLQVARIQVAAHSEDEVLRLLGELEA
jgi:acyl carrier protein